MLTYYVRVVIFVAKDCYAEHKESKSVFTILWHVPKKNNDGELIFESNLEIFHTYHFAKNILHRLTRILCNLQGADLYDCPGTEVSILTC